jgi:hypothetical protein
VVEQCWPVTAVTDCSADYLRTKIPEGSLRQRVLAPLPSHTAEDRVASVVRERHASPGIKARGLAAYRCTVVDPSPPRPTEFIVAEYETTQAAYLHYDAFRWQAGSLLIAGAFVFLGFLASGSASILVYAAASVVAAGNMTVWVLYSHHYRQLYLLKIDRLLELESVMGAEQHRRFNWSETEGKRYRSFGPAGHDLDQAVYLLTALAAPALAVAKDRASWWLVIPVLIVLAGFATVRRNEARMQVWLKGNRTLPIERGPEVPEPSGGAGT